MSGKIGEVIEFERATTNGEQTPQVRVDQGGANACTFGHWGPAGDDSPPLPSDVAVAVEAGGTGEAQAVGYQDPKLEGRADPGERRLVGRKAAGEVVCEVYLRRDGTIVVQNDEAAIELGPAGDVRIENKLCAFEMSATGSVTFMTPLGTFSPDKHVHPVPALGTSGPPVAEGGPPTP